MEQSLAQEFETAASNVRRGMYHSVSDKDKLLLYSYFKQAKEGDNKQDRPNGLFAHVEKMKWDSWKKLEGMSSEVAMKRYVSLVSSFQQ